MESAIKRLCLVLGRVLCEAPVLQICDLSGYFDSIIATLGRPNDNLDNFSVVCHHIHVIYNIPLLSVISVEDRDLRVLSAFTVFFVLIGECLTEIVSSSPPQRSRIPVIIAAWQASKEARVSLRNYYQTHIVRHDEDIESTSVAVGEENERQLIRAAQTLYSSYEWANTSERIASAIRKLSKCIE